jgi:hypothetical protein
MHRAQVSGSYMGSLGVGKIRTLLKAGEKGFSPAFFFKPEL